MRKAERDIVRDALIGYGRHGQVQAEATKAAQRAGIEHAKSKDGASYLGRKPSYTRRQFTVVRHMLGHDAVGIARIAKETGLSRQTVYRIKTTRLPPKSHWRRWGCEPSLKDEGAWRYKGWLRAHARQLLATSDHIRTPDLSFAALSRSISSFTTFCARRPYQARHARRTSTRPLVR
jgi:hypothetical protein